MINFAEALNRRARMMSDRLRAMKGKSRLHIPTPDEPLYVIFIDGMAALTCYITDRKIKDRIARCWPASSPKGGRRGSS